jgi:predicted Rossmann fold flavoprotein
MVARRIVVAGGGAAGYFAAIACAEARPGIDVTLYEATAHPLAKVRISGGGRCNVTHACFDAAAMAENYPRGSRELLGPLHRFGPAETMAWFEERGVPLKTEEDGRVFPRSDDSASVVDCLLRSAERAGAKQVQRCGVVSARRSDAGFSIGLSSGETIFADAMLIATGGTKGSAGPAIAGSLGHAIAPPVPSLFTFHIDDPRLRGLEGISVGAASIAVPGAKLKSSGALLITHWGLSGPTVLKLSAWGARELHAADYRFPVEVNWSGAASRVQAWEALAAERAAHARRRVAGSNPWALPARLWERMAASVGLAPEAIWAGVSNERLDALAIEASAARFQVAGKSMNKEEFVTCGGVSLREIDFASMQSRICPGLYLAGEVIDVDGVTGGFNLQAAWTTGWHAGRSMASAGRRSE